MTAGGPRARPFDRLGRILLAASLLIIVILIAAAIGVIALGAWIWRVVPNPDPFGFTSGLFFAASVLLIITSIAAIFGLLSYAGEYRSGYATDREGTARRWLGTLFIFAGFPFLGISIVLYSGPIAQVLTLGALLAFGTGAGYHVSAYLRTQRAGA